MLTWNSCGTLFHRQYANEKPSYRRGTVGHTMPVQILSTSAPLYEKSPFKRLAVSEWPWRSVKVIGIAIRCHYIPSYYWSVLTTTSSCTASDMIYTFTVYTWLPITLWKC